jgi:DedD protein
MATDLPEDSQLKRRARRRLIGAIALVLLAVIVLPMIFDAEQKPLDQDVSIQIPSQGDYVAKPPPAGTQASPSPPPAADAAKGAAPADASREASKDARTSPSSDAQPASVTPPPAPAPETRAETKADDAKAKAEAKAEAEKAKAAEAKAAEAKAAEAKAAEDKARAQADAKRAAALLNGADTTPSSDKSDKVAVAGTFAIQIGAFSSEDKVQEVRDKLSAAGLKSYAEKVATRSGEVIRVRAGPFASKEAAESARGKIAGLGFAGATVVHR